MDMKNDCKDIVRTKCNYGGAILMSVLTLLVLLCSIYVQRPVWERIFYFIIGIITTIWTLRQYAFSEKGVTIEICRIPIRRIKWKDIKQVGVITYKIYHLQIVTRDAERYKPNMDTQLYNQNYAARNLFKVFTVPYHQEYDEVIQKYYGEYDYFEKYDT